MVSHAVWKTWPSGLSNDKNLGLRPQFLSTESLGPCFSHGTVDHDQILQQCTQYWYQFLYPCWFKVKQYLYLVPCLLITKVLKVPGHQQVKCRQCKLYTELIWGIVTLYGVINLVKMSHVMVCCLMASSHYQTKCWLLINMLICDSSRCKLWHTSMMKIRLNVWFSKCHHASMS